MSSESLKISQVSNQDTPNKHSATQDCSDNIYISIFFDGTGNNRFEDGDSSSDPSKLDATKRKWSNPARMFRLAELYKADNDELHIHNVYVSGVGTKYNGSFSWFEAPDIFLEDTILGGGAGAGGTRRLNSGHQRINKSLKDSLLKIANQHNVDLKNYKINAENSSFHEINKKINSLNLIKKIRVSVFGFSRGAALARAFVNEWLWKCSIDNEQLVYSGIPIEFDMLGLYDTVASFGLPATNSANNLFDNRDLVVSDHVKKCVHYVAGNELRFSFPVDLIRSNGKLQKSNWIEKVFPGMHSDVGGGYADLDQGITSNIARVPLREMLNEGAVGGTKIFSYTQIAEMNKFKSEFELKIKINSRTNEVYNKYKSLVKQNGNIEEQILDSMKLYYSAYGSLYRNKIKTISQKERENGNFFKKYIGPSDMSKEVQKFEKAIAALKAPLKPENIGTFVYSISTSKWAITFKKWQYDAWEKNADVLIQELYLDYIHDSKVGFLSNAEPFSYFSTRGVYESQQSVYGWISDNINRPIEKISQEVEKTAQELKLEAEKKALELKRQTEKKALELKQQAEKKALELKQQAEKKAQELKREADKIVNTAKKEITQQYNNAIKQKNQIIKDVSKKYDHYSKEVDKSIDKSLDKGKKILKNIYDYF